MKVALLTDINLYKAAKYSLSFLWIFTGATSIFFNPEVGYEILSKSKMTGLFADIAVYGGGVLDIALGLWLLTRIKIKLCCLFQISLIVFYTLLLTLIDGSFWLHPFGPITKNIPILILIFIVMVNENKIA
ncbi:DoxX-like family protein [Pseudoalteromonas denitrificans DSM 6059]|uniref:DoxX-like family protein n=1 Tax=Pseudoalteromonas denitrificans DSM 6059 TaxID=1123010 RepID=A0A1I1MM58_9GAMM|nr:DoxX-like family protein [Pseudoalteromonas denitrificans DSM 6059]